jgi:hypothetical protein
MDETTEAVEATEAFLGEEILIRHLCFGGVVFQNICISALHSPAENRAQTGLAGPVSKDGSPSRVPKAGGKTVGSLASAQRSPKLLRGGGRRLGRKLREWQDSSSRRRTPAESMAKRAHLARADRLTEVPNAFLLDDTNGGITCGHSGLRIMHSGTDEQCTTRLTTFISKPARRASRSPKKSTARSARSCEVRQRGTN